MDRYALAARRGHQAIHRVGVRGAEMEDLSDLDAARLHELVGRYRTIVRIVFFIGRGVARRP